MSTLYNLEPNPTAKILLQTTAGDILLELFANQAPLASRNFLQLCLDGYYNNTIFHRIVPKFIIQGGDPTGTGEGGESSYDAGPFADEFHSRLKFNRRGLLGMANTGRANDNGSQFFLTLAETPELTGRNTMFGRVAGDTIYNVMKMGESELAEDGSERPLYPTRIIGTEILINPFDDMVQRMKSAIASIEEVSKKEKSKKKAKKVLLSFDDEGDEGEALPVLKKTKFNPKLMGSTAVDKPVPRDTRPLHVEPSRRKAEKSTTDLNHPTNGTKRQSSPPRPSVSHERSSSSRSVTPVNPSTKLEKLNAQIAAVRDSFKREGRGSEAPKAEKLSALEAMIPPTATRGRKRKPGGGLDSSRGQHQPMDLFNAFKNKLDQASPTPISPKAREIRETSIENGAKTKSEESADLSAMNEENICDLHFIADCQSCSKWDKGQDDEQNGNREDEGWMSHSLSFAKDRLGKDLEWKRKNEDELIVIDPREKAAQIKETKRHKK